jgi:hypothetical protein
MVKMLRLTAVSLVFGAVLAYSQPVILNSPTPWMTFRSDSILIKSQVDTSQINKKTVKYTLVSFNKNVKSILATKDIKVNDITSDFFLAKTDKNIIGGINFLKIEWAADGNKGTSEPIGVVNLDKLPKVTPINCNLVDEKVALKDMPALVKDDQMVKVGNRSFGAAWNKSALYIVMPKTADSSSITFALDCKNGKNAFLSYPDRFISYKKDSLSAFHYTRDITNDTLKYTENSWATDIVREVVGEKIIIKMPWYDTGALPFDGRILGFAVFVADDSKTVASNPDKADKFIPGTWGNLLLRK